MSHSSSDSEPTLRGPAAGQRVFGRYTLVTMLGRGGMGVVWRAHDETLHEDVALKFLPDAVRWDPAAYDDLKAETRRARQLTHPNIVRIHDFVEDASGAAISMELVEGRTLTALRLEKPNKIFEVADIAPWLPQLAAALDYAHTQARVVHRDLKPSNLMLTGAGVLKVADFGVARSLADSVTRVSMMSAGTLVYMSPQQAMGDPPSPADDVYALGATLYELLTGKPPFHTGDVRVQLFQRKPETIAARRRALLKVGDVAAASGAGGGGAGGRDCAQLPPEWETTIAACLAKEPGERPASLGEVVARLTSTKAEVGAGGRARDDRKTRSRRRWLVLAAGALLVAGAGVMGWGLWPAKLPVGGAERPRWSKVAPPTRLVSQITFDDEARDEGGQLLNLSGGHLVPTLDRYGRADRALLFSGSSSLAADAGPELRWSLRTPFSVACWVRTDATSRQSTPIIVSEVGAVGAPQWTLSIDPGGGPSFEIARQHQETPARRPVVAPQPLMVGRWHHVAAVSDGTEARVFVDGVLVAREAIADIETAVPARVRVNIGGGRLGDRQWFVGAMDELRLYRGALTAVEVRALAQAAPALYRPTRAIYGEDDDLTAAVRTEFGPTASVADWLEVKAAAGPQVERLADALGLTMGDNSYFVTRAGVRTFDGRRYYHVIRLNGTRPNYFLAHDELGGHVLALGSWYGQQMAVIARVPVPLPRVERMVPGEASPPGWSRGDDSAVVGRRLESRGGTVAVTREGGAEGEMVSTTWFGRIEAGARAATHGVEWTTTTGEVWAATCEKVGDGRDVTRLTLGRRDRPERVVEMRPVVGELVFTLVARAGVLRWRVTTASGGTRLADERLDVPGGQPKEMRQMRWFATAAAGGTASLGEIEWREEMER